MKILSIQEAQIVIDNVKSDIERGLKAGSYTSKKTGNTYSSGLEVIFNRIIDEAIEEYGVIATGSALEDARKGFDFTNPALYYPTRDEDLSDYQDEMAARFEVTFKDFLSAVLDELERDEEDNPELSEDEAEEYNRLRRQWQNRKSYYHSKGIELFELPELVHRGIRTELDRINLDNYIDLVNDFLAR